MSEVSDFNRKPMLWSTIIISSGLLLIFVRLAEQTAVEMVWGKHCGDTGVFYTGVIVVLIGAALMAVISLPLQWQVKKGSTRNSKGST